VAWWSRAVELRQWSDANKDIVGLRSPWAGDNVLQTIVGVPVGGEVPTVAAALSVPAVSRATALHSVVAAGSPWIPAEDPALALPSWLNKTQGVIPAGKRRVGLVQDIMFHNQAMLAVARDDSGQIQDAMHWPRWTWQLDAQGLVKIQNEQGHWITAPDQSRFVWIPGLMPMSFMEYAAASISQYVALCKTISNRAKSPIPLVELHVTEDWTGTKEELAAAQRAWNTAREAEGGSTAVTPKGLQVIIHTGVEDQSMLIEARNAIRLDFANFTNMNASILDGNSGASDNYSNTLQDANEFLRLSLGLYTQPITQRLSQDDVVGEELTWDHSKFDLTPAQGNTGQAVTTATPLPIGPTQA
jgi:hypothetical protein